jgi:hypothetical protein
MRAAGKLRSCAALNMSTTGGRVAANCPFSARFNIGSNARTAASERKLSGLIEDASGALLAAIGGCDQRNLATVLPRILSRVSLVAKRGVLPTAATPLTFVVAARG